MSGDQGLVIPAFVRGRLVSDDLVAITVDGHPAAFHTPDPIRLLDRLPLRDPVELRELNAVPITEIIDLLAEVGTQLTLERNEALREALARNAAFSELTPPVLRSCYEQLPSLFEPDAVTAVAEHSIGLRYLEGWAEVGGAAVRAFGARTVHIIAGNNPIIAAITIIRCAITRSDTIIKSPSNDPLTALAIVRTLATVAPGHPLTRHLSVAYWKGGTEALEQRLYHPMYVEKIVAWGGFASVKHVTRYLQPGLELITLDPKLSATVIGPEAFRDEPTMRETARLAAADVGVLNQQGCFNARVIYAVTGVDDAGLARANRWGELLHAAVQDLPEPVSTRAARFDPELRASIRALRGSPEWYRVFGGHDDGGAVLVSQLPEPVEFATGLSGRVANVVPITSPAEAVKAMNSYTQTVGVYPESLKIQLRDLAPLYGTQRLVSLGYATHFRPDLPQDGGEPTRRMVKWIIDETYQPDRQHPFSHLLPDAPPWGDQPTGVTR